MILLIIFAFVAGVVTVLSPCILPVLPIILSSADGLGKQKPLGVILGFVSSFTFFTLFLSTIVKLSGFPADNLRVFSVVILIIFGLSLLIPKVQSLMEILFSRLSNLLPTVKGGQNFVGGLLVGLSLGLLWTPCVGPILASVISLSITGTVTAQTALITFAYAIGTAIPMFAIMMVGSTALQKVPWLVRRTNIIQRAFGLLMIITAVGIMFNVDRKFQTWILNLFPNYGVGLTKFEDNPLVKEKLGRLGGKTDSDMIGKPTSEINSKGPAAAELIAGGEWINSAPLQLQELRGKVVLVDFWTYSCINCQRTLPYLKSWWEKYQQAGLVIIGVHSPEFEFEKNLKNVKQAVEDFGLAYPIMQDNDFATWRAYDNHYWPAKYLIDKDGYIRYTHFGEGEYDTTERYIQNLLGEAGTEVTSSIDNPDYQIYTKTPELYLGYDRIQYLSSQEKIVRDKTATYTAPTVLPKGSFAYQGQWLIANEYASPSVGSVLKLRFEAKAVFLVIRTKNGQAGQVKVTLDGQVKDLGVDVSPAGIVNVDKDTLYRLIDLQNPGEHELNLEFLDDNLEIYAFTFG